MILLLQLWIDSGEGGGWEMGRRRDANKISTFPSLSCSPDGSVCLWAGDQMTNQRKSQKLWLLRAVCPQMWGALSCSQQVELMVWWGCHHPRGIFHAHSASAAPAAAVELRWETWGQEIKQRQHPEFAYKRVLLTTLWRRIWRPRSWAGSGHKDNITPYSCLAAT